MVEWIRIETEDSAVTKTIAEILNKAGVIAQEDTPAPDAIPCLIVRDKAKAEARHLHMGRLTLDLDNVTGVLEDGSFLHFTPIEFAVLRYLLQNRHRAVSRDELLPAVWGFENDAGTRVADDTVKRLRRKLTNTGVCIETVWGFGFKVTENI